MTFISQITMPRPRLIRHRKRIFDDGMILEMALWDVSVLGRAHRLDYALSYGTAEARVIGYDSVDGGDLHRRCRGQQQEPYRFVSPERLVADFLADVHAARNNG